MYQNPENYFAEVEQAAFSPSTLVPGISPSPDIMLHARMFSYPDAQRYRVGPNYQQLPVNTPRCPVYAPYERDGAATVNKNYGGDPVYVGSRFRSIVPGPKDMRHEEWAGRVQDYASEFDPVEDVRQPRELWTLMKKNGDDIRLVNNLASHIGRAVPELQQGAIGSSSLICDTPCSIFTEMFSLVDKELSDRIAHQIKEQGTGKSQ
jgi:catalase